MATMAQATGAANRRRRRLLARVRSSKMVWALENVMK